MLNEMFDKLEFQVAYSWLFSNKVKCRVFRGYELDFRRLDLKAGHQIDRTSSRRRR